jgi:hypothetical protein
MHFNENAGRPVATLADGSEQFLITWPKVKGGEYTVREAKVKITYRELVDLFH